MTIREQLSERLAARGMTLGLDRFESLCAYVELLVKWNRRINLTGFALEDGVTEAAFDRLVIEPLAAARIAISATRVLDIGSGGGSPAIPFVLGLDAAAQLVLVESRSKKAVFLREALRWTAISGRVVTDRYEHLIVADPFDAVTVRAVAPEAQLWDLVRRTLSAEGRLFWFHSAAQVQPDQSVVRWEPPMALLEADSRLSVGRLLG